MTGKHFRFLNADRGSMISYGSRAVHNAKLLLDLIARFPTENPSHTDSEVDIPKLFNQIRSRYKMLCALIGIKPSLRAAQSASQASVSVSSEDNDGSSPRNVWRIDNADNPGGVDFSF